MGLPPATPVGVHAFGRSEYEIRDGEVVYMDRGPVGIMVTEEHPGPASEPATLRDLSEALIAVYGTDYGVHSPTWISRFTDMTQPGGGPTATDGCCWPATPHTCIPRWVDKASTSGCRTR